MKTTIKLLLFIITLATQLVSCSHQLPADRAIATQSEQACLNSVKGEYQTYFDSVEKCIEKESPK